MASLTGYTKVFAGDTTAVDTTKKHPLGTRAMDVNGNEYIYLTGVASTEAGSWVSFDEVHITTLTVANAKGRVAIAMAATVASTYGWYQIYGKSTTALVASTVADNALLYLHASAGRVDDVDVSGDLILGAIARSLATNVASPLTVELNYPCVDDVADD